MGVAGHTVRSQRREPVRLRINEQLPAHLLSDNTRNVRVSTLHFVFSLLFLAIWLQLRVQDYQIRA